MRQHWSLSRSQRTVTTQPTWPSLFPVTFFWESDLARVTQTSLDGTNGPFLQLFTWVKWQLGASATPTALTAGSSPRWVPQRDKSWEQTQTALRAEAALTCPSSGRTLRTQTLPNTHTAAQIECTAPSQQTPEHPGREGTKKCPQYCPTAECHAQE